MASAILRLNFVQPGLEPTEMASRYRAGLELASFADEHGFAVVTLEEHHGADDGWSPTPLLTAGAILARTTNLGVSISALLLPLHDPLRVAEDIAVCDLIGGGRLSTIVGLGYRPEEYAAHGKDWSRRGALMDEAIEVLLKAWTGEPFEYRGTTVRVTPVPVTKPHPMLMLGGTSKVAARRAVRFGLPMFLAAPMPELLEYHRELAAAEGSASFAMMPDEGFHHHFLHEDPDAAWAELGTCFLHEAATYASWQTPDIRSAVHSHATTVEELRAEGIYRIVSPDEAIEEARAGGPAFTFNFHPLIGGMPIDEAWKSMQLYADTVAPALAG